MSERNCSNQNPKVVVISSGDIPEEIKRVIGDDIPSFLTKILEMTCGDDSAIAAVATCNNCGKIKTFTMQEAIEAGILPSSLDSVFGQTMEARKALINKRRNDMCNDNKEPKSGNENLNAMKEMPYLKNDQEFSKLVDELERSQRNVDQYILSSKMRANQKSTDGDCQCHGCSQKRSNPTESGSQENTKRESYLGTNMDLSDDWDIIKEVQEKSEAFFKELRDTYGDDIINAVCEINSSKYFPDLDAMNPGAFMRRRMYETFGSITDIEEMVSDIDDTCDNIEDYLRNMNQGIHAIFTLLRGWDESRGQLKEGLAVMAEPLQMATLQSYDPINRDTIKRIADKRIARQLDDFEELIRKIINKKIRRHEKEEHSSWDCFEDNVREIVYGMFEKHNDIRRFLDDRAREEAGDISADDNE